MLAHIATTDPERSVRCEAVKRLKDQALLAHIVMTDTDLLVRWDAVYHLSDEHALRRIAERGADAYPRFKAAEKLRDRDAAIRIALGTGVPCQSEFVQESLRDLPRLVRVFSDGPPGSREVAQRFAEHVSTCDLVDVLASPDSEAVKQLLNALRRCEGSGVMVLESLVKKTLARTLNSVPVHKDADVVCKGLARLCALMADTVWMVDAHEILWHLSHYPCVCLSYAKVKIAAFRTLEYAPDRTVEVVAISDSVSKQPQESGILRILDLGNGVGLDMVWVPATTSSVWQELSGGSTHYLMGCPEDEARGKIPDTKSHPVTLTRGFWMSAYPVTQGQWVQVVGSSIREQPNLRGNPDGTLPGEGALYPMSYVNWSDCQRFVAGLNELYSGACFRLPSEAEWEYACRAGSTGLLAKTGFGHELAPLDENNSGMRGHEVGERPPNSWGLYDMHGNVFEWCEDWYGPYPATQQTDPTGPEGGDERVCRGGSWASPTIYCTSPYRWATAPNKRPMNFGFRVVCSDDGRETRETAARAVAEEKSWKGLPVRGDTEHRLTQSSSDDQATETLSCLSGGIVFDRQKARQALLDRGRNVTLVEEDLDLVESEDVPPAMVQQAADSGQSLGRWMWSQIGPAQPFVRQAFEQSENFTAFAVTLAAKGQAQWAAHLYRALSQQIP